MVVLEFHADFTDVLTYLDKLSDWLRGGRPDLADSLGRIVKREMMNYVGAGGTQRKQGGKAWPVTHPKWVKLRGKTHNRPLYNTGEFMNDFDYEVLSGLKVRVGNAFKGARRFHFGDKALGKKWRWPGVVDSSGKLIDTGRIAALEARNSLLGGNIRWFSPVIQARPYLEVFQEDVDDWIVKVDMAL